MAPARCLRLRAQRGAGARQVLCSVADVGAALDEARRVLRRGGTFAFIEHVAAPADRPLLRVAQVRLLCLRRRAGPQLLSPFRPQ